jgi:hypothetical protein
MTREPSDGRDALCRVCEIWSVRVGVTAGSRRVRGKGAKTRLAGVSYESGLGRDVSLSRGEVPTCGRGSIDGHLAAKR